MKTPICIDFETEAIQSRPRHPPKPVGCAFKYPGKKGRYVTDLALVKRELQDIWHSGEPVLMHNAKFDLDVVETYFGVKPLPWDRVHDTLFLLFLEDPHASSLSLKPASERLLGMPPEERDAVRDWLVDAGIITKAQNPGPFICKAPAALVGPYAIGDVERTVGLFKLLYAKFDSGMRQAYDRERKLLPILLQNEREGMRVDLNALERDAKAYTLALEKCEAWLRKALDAPGLEFDNDKDVGEALFKSKVVTNWVMTKGGNGRPPQRSVAKDNLTVDRFEDKKVHAALDYRNRLKTVLSMSILPWLEQAGGEGKGRIFTEWNQVRQSHGAETNGARTGRLSCSRFMNISKSYKNHVHPKQIKSLPPLPLVRRYVLPEPGGVWNHRDYKQQEYKVLAHFEDADLMAAYIKNPELDQHDAMKERLTAKGYAVDRDTAKMVNLAIIYALGVAGLARKLGMSEADARAVKSATKAALPGVAVLEAKLRNMAVNREPVRSWGGALLLPKPPAIAKTGGRKGEFVDYSYTLLNLLIQHSAADCTKEALIRYDSARREARLLVPVHDEINISAPEKALEREDRILKEVMESIEFDVLMLTDRKVGPSWGELEKVK